MSYSIIYSTHTDNIIKLAGQIEAALPKEEIIFDGRIEAVEDFDTKADVIFIGFWTTKNSCDAKIAELLSTLKNKKIAIFGTCGFGGDEKHFNIVKNNVLKNVDPSNQVLDFYLCLGRIGYEYVHKAKEANGDPKVDFHFPMYLKFAKEDEGHPTKDELDNVYGWAKSIVEKA